MHDVSIHTSFPHAEGDTFLEHPATQTVLPGAIANFTCAFHCDDGVNYYFQVNENRIVDSSEFLRYDSECNEAETTCSLSIYLLADGSQNPNGSTVQCFVNCGGEYGPSEIAYLYIAGMRDDFALMLGSCMKHM